MHIDQVIVGASPGDAVTESAIRIRDALRGAVQSDLYSLHIDDRLRGQVGRLQDYPIPRDRGPSDVIIYHVSIGDVRVVDFLLHRSERMFVIYHNITPSSFFRRHDGAFADLLDQGRAMLPAILARAEFAIADSEFNAAELRSLGRHDVVVSAPPINLGRLLDVVPDTAFTERLPPDVPVSLFVGQLLPHKSPVDLLGAQHVLNANWQPTARMVLAGTVRGEGYASAVGRLIDVLGLNTVWQTGEINDGQLAALYRRADVFVTASRHEGFCVPLVEAFHFGVPVIARGAGAVPDTAGDAAILLDSDAGPLQFAEAIRRVLQDHDLRSELIERGHQRAKAFDVDQLVARMLAAIAHGLHTRRVFT